MKGATYILKNTLIEHYNLEEQKNHHKRLQRIVNTKPKLTIEPNNLRKTRNRFVLLDNEFRER
jgi:hypothetical protein